MKQLAYHEFRSDAKGWHTHYLGEKELRESKSGLSNSRRKSHPTEERPLLDQTRKAKLTVTCELLPKQIACNRLSKEYGKCKDIIHYGHHSTIRMHRKAPNELYAVKVTHNLHNSTNINILHQKNNNVTRHLNHSNLVQIREAFTVAEGDGFLIMDYCEGHDLHSLLHISNPHRLPLEEADCFFKQIIRGVHFLHGQEMAHCNLAPRNILLTRTGCVKITALETLTPCFCLAKQVGNLGFLNGQETSNIPSAYLAPEYFTSTRHDLRPGDVWATGLIYMLMRTGRLYWFLAKEKQDPRYDQYLARRIREAFDPIENIEHTICRNVIYAMLNPNEKQRITISEVLRSEWVQGIVLCNDATGLSLAI